VSRPRRPKTQGEEGSRRSPGRPRVLSHKRIVETAKSIPFEDLSFARVSAELGVSPQALYKYFSNIGELRAALAGALSAEREFKEQWNDWRTSDDGITGFLTKIGVNYRRWLQVNELEPALFRLEYGGIRFASGYRTAVLLERMDHFLLVASELGVPLGQAMRLWHVTSDVMTTTQSLEVTDDFERDFRLELAQYLDESDEQFLSLEAYLETEPETNPPHAYEDTVRALILGLSVLYGLGNARSPQEAGESLASEEAKADEV